MNHLIVLLKNPRKGSAKTRIASEIGDDLTLAIYYELLHHLRQVLDKLGDVNIHLFFSEDCENVAPFDTARFRCYVQEGTDLGSRMQNAARAIASLDDEASICVIGSDCPYLGAAHIRHTFDLLSQYDLVLGPAHDGGYYLIGFNHVQDVLFEDIPWSTDQVLNKTIAKAQKEQQVFFLLPTLSDIDTYDDFLEWKGRKHI